MSFPLDEYVYTEKEEYIYSERFELPLTYTETPSGFGRVQSRQWQFTGLSIHFRRSRVNSGEWTRWTASVNEDGTSLLKDGSLGTRKLAAYTDYLRLRNYLEKERLEKERLLVAQDWCKEVVQPIFDRAVANRDKKCRKD